MKKKTSRVLTTGFIIALISVLCLQFVTPGFAYAEDGGSPAAAAENAPTYDYMSPENAPVFYGTTAIKVPTGTAIDYEHDARFRIFAKDNEDFDLTNQIEVVSENLDTSAPGHYEIAYRVADSDGNTIEITVPVDVEDDRDEIWLEKTMYTLPSVDHLNALGHYRGNYMDRQMIGIFLDADDDENVGTFEMRKISGEGNLTVTIQNNNGNCESTVTVAGKYDLQSNDGWQTVKNTGSATAEHDGSLAAVPTVKTLYKENGPVVYEVKYDVNDEKVQPLHYYHEGDGFAYETQFLAEWQEDVDSFAVLDGVSLMALMPYEDRKLVYNKTEQRSFDNFDEMFAFWTAVCNNYDELIGISYTPDYYWNQAVKTKYFVRANKHGAGSAYYAYTDCVGKNSTSMYSALHPWWGTLHEYGHGYQGNLGSTGYGMSITEIAVNIFSYYLQELSGIYPANDHWLGNIDTKEAEWNKKRKEGIKYEDTEIGSDTALYTLINVLYSFGDYKETYAYINQYYREVYFTTGKKLNTQDAWILAMEEKENVNLVPYFESWGIVVSDDVKNHMMQSDAEVAYYLNDMLSDPALATDIKKKLGNQGEYDLVTTSELEAENLTGTVKLTFNISDFEKIKNEYLYINNGTQEIAKVQVTEPEMTLTLPAGIYKVAPPRGKVALEFELFYMTVVNDVETPYEIVYRDIDDMSYGNEIRIQSRGYWEPTSEAYLPFVIETQGNSVKITYRGTRPNSNGYPSTEIFSEITLFDENGEEIYSKNVNGGLTLWINTTTPLIDNLDVALGYKLKIYYRGKKTDMTITGELTGEELPNYRITNEETDEITYVFTTYGLVPEEIAEDEDALYEMYKERVNGYIEEFLAENEGKDFDNPFVNSKELSKISDLISKFTPEDQAPYAGIFTNGSTPVITFGSDSYTYEANTFDMEQFKSEITITDVEEGTIDVNGDNVKITSDIDWGKAGTYTITVEVTDIHGNVATAEITVTIVDSSSGDNNGGNGSDDGNKDNNGDQNTPGSDDGKKDEDDSQNTPGADDDKKDEDNDQNIPSNGDEKNEDTDNNVTNPGGDDTSSGGENDSTGGSTDGNDSDTGSAGGTDTPENPAAPGTPDAPETSDDSANPGNSGSTDTPGVPNTPSDTTDESDTPDNPDNPSDTSDVPNNPPEIPDDSNTPNNTNTPSDTPDTPNNSSGTPGNPANPSNTPNQPGNSSGALNEPNTPSDTTDKPVNSSNAAKSPQTGDNSHIVLWFTLMAISAIGLCWNMLFLQRKRRNK